MSPSANPRVLFSVVVPTFERPRQLAECLEALAVQTLPRPLFEVVVVVDGGGQSLEQLVDRFTGRLQIKLLRQANEGCASARQLGIDHAQGEYLAFTDDDCRPAPDWLTRIAAALKRAPDCAIAGRTINGAADNVYADATQSIVETLTTSRTRCVWGTCVTLRPTTWLSQRPPSWPSGDWIVPWRIAGGEGTGISAHDGIEPVSGWRMKCQRKCFTTIA